MKSNRIKSIEESLEPIAVPTRIIKKIKFKTLNQKRLYKSITHQTHNIILAHALAGAGKTHISIHAGLEMLLDRDSCIDKLVIIKPTIDVAGEDRLGFLPGDLMEKIEFQNESSVFILNKIIGPVETKRLIDNGKIEFRVLNFLRGMNFENTFIILDEAQNASILQIKTLVTRISDDSKLVIQGDLSQCDKFMGRDNGNHYVKSGFYDLWYRLAGVKGVYQIEFLPDDCVRSGIVKRVLSKYEATRQILLGEKNLYEIMKSDDIQNDDD
jgi:phosphate starvation-inducible PhoH-like protein